MSDKPHLGGAYPDGDSNTFCPDVFGYLLVKHELKSVLDIGCGFGHTMKWFADHGLCQVKGIEGWDEAVQKNLMPKNILQHDYTTGPSNLGTPFDLAWSSEFLEHIEEKHLPNVMLDFRLARYVCITHGEPGQAGFNHVNCQPSSYWVKKFKEHGFEHDAEETELLRRTDRWRAGWGRRTLMHFTREI